MEDVLGCRLSGLNPFWVPRRTNHTHPPFPALRLALAQLSATGRFPAKVSSLTERWREQQDKEHGISRLACITSRWPARARARARALWILYCCTVVEVLVGLGHPDPAARRQTPRAYFPRGADKKMGE